ncbi:tail fiber domain-containing protein [Phreatobacter stygius]|uniref:Tail fiber domain-containing protein n=1 Tax=Phreatobacter stygius TaxID=1940610 RepID=A0A4D7BBR5_9HYPH|nr:tail fiber domain-containing protein [Phreatobacter stygius]QCI67528.1 tail fiber domain-containing protein [Phreatobacter stygius]
MVSTPSPPTPPDPKETAAAQTQMNRETAITQYGLNAANQVTPDGSLSYRQIGTWADGTPRYEATQALSGANQKIYDTTKRTQQNVADIGATQSAKIGSLLNTPFSADNNAIEGRLNQLARARLDPLQAQQEDALRTRLANQGIQPGSAAFEAEMRGFNQSKNDANNQLLLTGRNQAFQELLTERNQPLNEISALMSGSQVKQPSFVGTPQSNVANTDYAGMVNAKHQSDMAAWNAQNQSNNAMMGGLFGLAGAGLGLFKPSDRRLKRDVARVGELDNGLTVYRYRYQDGGPPEIGLMAEDVRKLNPEAVATMENGLMAVDYQSATRPAPVKRAARRAGKRNPIKEQDHG